MKQDELGHPGTFLRKNVATVAERGMALNMRRLAPLVLPYSELVLCLYSIPQHCLWMHYMIAMVVCLSILQLSSHGHEAHHKALIGVLSPLLNFDEVLTDC